MLKPRRFSAPRGNARQSILSLDSVPASPNIEKSGVASKTLLNQLIKMELCKSLNHFQIF